MNTRCSATHRAQSYSCERTSFDGFPNSSRLSCDNRRMLALNDLATVNKTSAVSCDYVAKDTSDKERRLAAAKDANGSVAIVVDNHPPETKRNTTRKHKAKAKRFHNRFLGRIAESRARRKSRRRTLTCRQGSNRSATSRGNSAVPIGRPCFFTVSICLLQIMIFFHMCCGFRAYLEAQGCFDHLIDSYMFASLSVLPNWIRRPDEKWALTAYLKWSFTSDYLVTWGARHLPSLKYNGSAFSWLSSAFVHLNFVHWFSNLIGCCLFSMSLERKFGGFMVATVFFVSHLGGALFSAIFEDTSVVVAGASGGIFGLLGFYFVDWVLNFHRDRRSLVRLAVFIFFLIYFAGSDETRADGVSHFSHLGGLIFALYPSYIFTTQLLNNKLKRPATIIAGVLHGFFFAFLWCYVHCSVMAALLESDVIKPLCNP